MVYTIDDYKKVCDAARKLSVAVNALKEAEFYITNGDGWANFGECLRAVYAALYEYYRVNNQCAIEAHEREKNGED
jgi:hypothetical protein